ncbi:MAG: hypothetical protein P8Y60_10965 [Calditrichota bacterium]
MPQYIIVYLGGTQPSDPEESKQNYAKYKNGWFHWETRQSDRPIRLRIPVQ